MVPIVKFKDFMNGLELCYKVHRNMNENNGLVVLIANRGKHEI